MEFIDINLSTLTLPNESSVKRMMPRRVEDRQADYEEKFDAYTLFSDIFFRGNGDIEFLGPPLLNLAQDLGRGRVLVDGQNVIEQLILESTDRITRLLLKNMPNSQKVEIEIGNIRFSAPIQPNICDFFCGKNVLVTQQKDNPIEWIVYWALYHIVHHKINAVVIYDNNSQKYKIDELKQALAKIPQLEKVCIVDWKIPFGATGGANCIWDSDYGQYQSWEHGLHRLVYKANTVIINDIDELIVPNPAEEISSVPDLFAKYDESVFLLRRKKIVEVGVNKSFNLLRTEQNRTEQNRTEQNRTELFTFIRILGFLTLMNLYYRNINM